MTYISALSFFLNGIVHATIPYIFTTRRVAGNIVNLITCTIANSTFVCIALSNIYTDHRKGLIYDKHSSNAIMLHHIMTGYFMYDTLYLINSTDQVDKNIVIIHHLASIIVAQTHLLYPRVDNLSVHILIAILESSAAVINITNIAHYFVPKTRTYYRIVYTAQGVYFVNRVVIFFGWLVYTHAFIADDICSYAMWGCMCGMYIMSVGWFLSRFKAHISI